MSVAHSSPPMLQYYNTGDPTSYRGRRGTGPEPPSSKDVPAELVNPDGTISIGLVCCPDGSSSSSSNQENQATSRSSVPTGSCVVFSGPLPAPRIEPIVLIRQRLLYLLLGLDLIFLGAQFVGGLRKPTVGPDVDEAGGPTLTAPRTTGLAFDSLILVAGGLFVRSRWVDGLSMLMVASLASIFLGLLWLPSLLLLVHHSLQIAIVCITADLRSHLTFTWLPAR
mmetsp:Transcript_22063/g.37881  ORF Transcript_22063/g.37881 Transcript_22063/m.37881 type:complete len:224 (-) Transcript_22063:66-737(-)